MNRDPHPIDGMSEHVLVGAQHAMTGRGASHHRPSIAVSAAQSPGPARHSRDPLTSAAKMAIPWLSHTPIARR
jgi:hypothetical protein